MKASGDDQPVVKVSWRDASAYASWLSRKTGRTYRLPTDEEWVFAAGSRVQRRQSRVPKTASIPRNAGWRAMKRNQAETFLIRM